MPLSCTVCGVTCAVILHQIELERTHTGINNINGKNNLHKLSYEYRRNRCHKEVYIQCNITCVGRANSQTKVDKKHGILGK